MKNCLYLLIFSCLLVHCTSPKATESSAAPEFPSGNIMSLIPDTASSVVLMNYKQHYFDTKKYTDYFLTTEDKILIDSLFIAVFTRNEEQLMKLSSYKRQYLAVVNNSTNEVEVFVNCFCDESWLDWKEYLMIVNDGGNCFFSVQLNLSRKSFSNFYVNGDA